MKKIMLTAAAIAVLSTSSAYAAEGAFYAKGNVGWVKLDTLKADAFKLKSKNNIFLGAGVGYYVMDNVRADLTFDYYTNTNHNGSAVNKSVSVNGVSLKAKSQASTLLVNGFVDMFDVSVAKIFAGAGVGMSMINSKVTWTEAGNAEVAKSKKKNNFAYAIHLGASAEVATGVNAELTYSYRDMGKLKALKWASDGSTSAMGSLKGHHVAAGIRFDI